MGKKKKAQCESWELPRISATLRPEQTGASLSNMHIVIKHPRPYQPFVVFLFVFKGPDPAAFQERQSLLPLFN